MTELKWVEINAEDSYDPYHVEDGGTKAWPTGYWIDVGERNVWLSTPQGQTLRFEAVAEAQAEGKKRAKEEGL